MQLFQFWHLFVFLGMFYWYAATAPSLFSHDCQSEANLASAAAADYVFAPSDISLKLISDYIVDYTAMISLLWQETF